MTKEDREKIKRYQDAISKTTSPYLKRNYERAIKRILNNDSKRVSKAIRRS